MFCYYACKEAFDREAENLQRADHAKAAAKKLLDEADTRLLLIECAHYYGQLKEIENQITAISKEIHSRENHSESSGKLASLKYSAYLAIHAALDRIAPKLAELTQEKADQELLFQEAEDRWLPAVLPVLTAEDLDAMLRGNAPRFSAVAACSKDYFQDSKSYTAGLQDTLKKQRAHKALLEEREKSLEADRITVEAFAVYDENWEAKVLAQKDKAAAEVSSEQTLVNELNAEVTALKDSLLNAKNHEKQRNTDLNSVQSKRNDYARLLEKLEDRYKEITRKLCDLTESAKSLRSGLELVSDASEAEAVIGAWSDLLGQYQALLAAQSADLKRLNDDLIRLRQERDEKQREIQKRNCDPAEYEALLYSEDAEEQATKKKQSAQAFYQEADTACTAVGRVHAKAEASLENAEKKLSEFGSEALPPHEVGKDFDSRISKIRKQLAELEQQSKRIAGALSQLQLIQGKTEAATEAYQRPLKCGSIPLEEDYAAQLSSLTKGIREWKKSAAASERKVDEQLKKMAEVYGAGSADVRLALSSMRDLLANAVIRGDRYFTLCEHIDANMHTVQLRISQIDTDLKEFHKAKGDLIHQCVIQGRRMYEGLTQLSNHSKVNVQNRRRQMLRFDIPETVDENVAGAAIAAEIDKGTEEIVAKMAEDEFSESDVHKIAARTVGSKRLLRQYIGSENIILKAYKVDRNPDHSGYRTWEQTQINNSGAEKFVVYFAVILALMAYTRDSFHDIGEKNKSVLILDNPFGPISSKHVLEPMFEISGKYHVQLICLSDISKSDIVSCFDLVIRVVVKQFALSSREQLTHEGNEVIEHGFYRSEQMNLF